MASPRGRQGLRLRSIGLWEARVVDRTPDSDDGSVLADEPMLAPGAVVFATDAASVRMFPTGSIEHADRDVMLDR